MWADEDRKLVERDRASIVGLVLSPLRAR